MRPLSTLVGALFGPAAPAIPPAPPFPPGWPRLNWHLRSEPRLEARALGAAREAGWGPALDRHWRSAREGSAAWLVLANATMLAADISHHGRVAVEPSVQKAFLDEVMRRGSAELVHSLGYLFIFERDALLAGDELVQAARQLGPLSESEQGRVLRALERGKQREAPLSVRMQQVIDSLDRFRSL